jgi:hypothetical protein
MNVANRHHPSLLPHLEQNLLYQFLPSSMSPVMPLRGAECVFEGAQARTT